MLIVLLNYIAHAAKSQHQEIQFFRSSRPHVFCKKSALENFTKFTEKQLCQSFFFYKFVYCSFLIKLRMASCIWKFVRRQSSHLGFRWRYRRILFGYQAIIFHFSFFNVSHKSLSFITWNIIEYLHTQDFQRATAHLNVWTNILLFCFVYGCKQHAKIS